MVYGFMPGPEQINTNVPMPKEQTTAGNAIGILGLDIGFLCLPGNVQNSTTFNFPVFHKILKGSNLPQIFNADPALLDLIVEGGKELEKQGVRAITGACGYFGNYQKEVAVMLDVPVFLSSILQVQIIKQGLKPNQKVGIICAEANSLTPKLLNQCGVDDLSDIVVAGAQDLPEFRKNIIELRGPFNSYKVEQELVELAKQLISNNPDIGAILLECSDMPPYAWSIQNAVRLPVFDFTTLINWVYSAVVRRPFAGFI